MTPSASCLTVVVAVVVLLSTLSAAQYQPYTAAPVILYTFDNQVFLGPPVANTTTITTTTHFTWTQRVGNVNNQPNPNFNVNNNNNHYGIASFNGVLDMINMNQYPDNLGRTFNITYGGGGIAFEYWVWFTALNTATRLADIGNGYYYNNIWNFIQTTNDLAWRIYDGPTEYSYDVPATAYAVTEGSWRHIVCQIVPLGATSTQGNMTCYINGVQQTTSTTVYKTSNLPSATVRNQAFFGQIQLAPGGTLTQPSVTPHFNGYLDLLAFYNNSLTLEQIQAHSLLIRPPIFEVYFGTNPALINGISGTTTSYSWLSVDTNDAQNVQSFHNGLLTFSGTNNQYADLTKNTGANSIGTILPNIGGPGSGIGGNDGLIAGMSIDLVVKVSSGAVASRIFSTGNGAGNNEVYIAYDPSGTISFTANNAAGTGTSTMTIGGVSTGVWYHVAFTLQVSNNNGGNNGYAQSCTAYLNGVNVQQSTNCSYPPLTTRTNAFLGTSAVGVNSFAGEIDLLRVFDFALTANLTANLYGLTVTGLPPQPAFSYAPTGLTSPGPILSYTFDAPLPSTFDTGATDTNFSWVASNGAHTGLAAFNGAFDLSTTPVYETAIDMNLYPDIYNNTMPIVGGALSCEAWVLFQAIPLSNTFSNGFTRIFELAGVNSLNSDNIFFTQYGVQPNYYIATFNTSAETSAPTVSNPIVVGAWQHLVMTIGGGTQNTASSTVSLYINGSLATLNPNQLGGSLFYTPRYVQRPVALIGKSAEIGNALFAGYMDSISFYNYALSQEQVTLHYQASLTGASKVPFIDLAFSNNLYVINPLAAYSWAPYDTTDSPTVQAQRTGILLLNATTTAASSLEYVALSASTGTNSMLLSWPTFGGTPVGNGLNGAQLGWTIEVVFKEAQYGGGFGQSVSNSNIFDWASGTNGDRLTLGYGANANANGILYFSISNSQSGQSSSIPVISPVTSNTWYYVSIVLTPTTATSGTITVYVNGQFVLSSGSNAAYPQYIARQNSFLGKSNTGGNTWTGAIDSIRVYDFALQSAQVAINANSLNLFTPVSFAPVNSSSAGAAAVTTSSTALNGGGGGSGLSGGAIAGIIIGVIVFCICVLILLVFFLCYYTPGKKPAASSDGNAEVAVPNSQNPYSEQSDVQTSDATHNANEGVEMQGGSDQETV